MPDPRPVVIADTASAPRNHARIIDKLELDGASVMRHSIGWLDRGRAGPAGRCAHQQHGAPRRRRHRNARSSRRGCLRWKVYRFASVDVRRDVQRVEAEVLGRLMDLDWLAEDPSDPARQAEVTREAPHELENYVAERARLKNSLASPSGDIETVPREHATEKRRTAPSR